jgi:hypothetical protein
MPLARRSTRPSIASAFRDFVDSPHLTTHNSQLSSVAPPKPSPILRGALFTLVPVAYLSLAFWRPANGYGPAGREGLSAVGVCLMLAVFLVSMLSWDTHRWVAALGLLACFLWLAILLLPVL